jgi:uncharacterized protein YceH (UPF0502 family)
MKPLHPIEARLLGVLLEKESTTPEQYPLSLNSLTLGCNQKTNRDPVTSYVESEVHEHCEALLAKHLILRHHGIGSRTAKFKHQIRERFGADNVKLQVLSALLLKGAQTPGEILLKIKRSCPELLLEQLIEQLEDDLSAETPWFNRLERQPGQKEARWRHTWASDELVVSLAENEYDSPQSHQPLAGMESGLSTPESTPTDTSLNSTSEELISLREEVQLLRDEVNELREKLEEVL